MESIKGSEVNVPDAVFAWVFDGRGGARPLEDQDHIDSEHPCWLHLNYTHPDSAEWLASTPLCPTTFGMRWREKVSDPASAAWVRGR